MQLIRGSRNTSSALNRQCSLLQRVRMTSSPTLVLGIVLSLLLAYLVIVPVVLVVIDMMTVHIRDATALGQPAGSFTLNYLQRALTSRVSGILFWTPLLHTLLVSAAITVLALTIGYLLAWFITRTDMKWRRIVATLAVVPFMLPSWTFAAAWITALKNRRLGGVPGFMEALGFQPPDILAYGAVPIVLTLSLHYFPLAFLLFGNAFRRIDSQMEESAQILGANRWQTARRVLFPIMRPAIMSAVLLTFARSVGTFGAPYMLGRPTNFDTLATSLYSSFRSGNPGVMAVIATGMIILGMSLVAIDLYLLREYKRYVTMGGKGHMARPATLGKWRTLVSTGVGAFAVSVIVVPLGILALSTVMVTPGWFRLHNFTLQFWIAEETPVREGAIGLLRDPRVLRVIWNSIRVSVVGALICGVLGTLVGYSSIRLQPSFISKYLRQTSFLPYLVPGIGFGAAYLLLFAVPRGPIPGLYGTLALMILAMGINYLPFTSRSSVSSMSQMGKEPEEAAMILGAGWTSRLFRIVLPIQKRAMFGGILLAFVQGMKELSLVIMLARPGLEVLTTQAIRYSDNALHQMANGVILIIVVVTFTLTLLLQRVTGSNLAQGLGT